jgi:hypothetical protein
MNADDRDFHIREGREVINASIYAWLFGYEDSGLYFYMDGPTEVLAYMGWPALEPSLSGRISLACI